MASNLPSLLQNKFLQHALTVLITSTLTILFQTPTALGLADTFLKKLLSTVGIINSTVSLPFYLLLLLIILPSLMLSLFSKKAVKAIKLKLSPYSRYTKDEIEGIPYSWVWIGPKVGHLNSYCPGCSGELHPTTTYKGGAITPCLKCSCCDAIHIPPKLEDNLGHKPHDQHLKHNSYITSEILRRLRIGEIPKLSRWEKFLSIITLQPS